MNEQPQRIERAVMDSLTSGDGERFKLVPHRVGAVKLALQASLQTAEAVGEVRRLLQLIVALEQRLGSPQAAEGLRDVIRSDPDALSLIQAHIAPNHALSAARRFAEQQGEAPALRAPAIDQAPPADSVRVSDFLDAGGGPVPLARPLVSQLLPSRRAASRVRRGNLED